MLGAMTTLRRHTQRPRRTIGAATRPTHENLTGTTPMLRAQTQPAHEILLVPKAAHIRADLAEKHQRRRLTDPFQNRQIHARHLEQQRPRTKTHFVLLRLAPTLPAGRPTITGAVAGVVAVAGAATWGGYKVYKAMTRKQESACQLGG